jgi:uncharacterized protein YegL
MAPNRHEDKIGVLNRSLVTMFDAFARLDSVRGRVHVGVIVFGGEEARLHMNVTAAPEAEWNDMEAAGRTPMGAAFDLAREVLEDADEVPPNAFQATIVLVSDGVPTDEDWETSLQDLCASPRGAKALRIALGIGTDLTPDAVEVLRRFSTPGIGVLRAEQADQIPEHFKWITQTVTDQMQVGFAPPSLDDLDRF